MPLYAKTFACIAVCAGVFGAVEYGQMHEQVRKRLERKLDEKFVGSIEAKRLTGSLLWGFTAHDVDIRDASGEPVAHIDELQVDASAFGMLRGQVRFDHATLVRPVVFVERLEDGSTNVRQVFKSKRPSRKTRLPGSVVFEMARVDVVDGELVYVDSSGTRGGGKPTPAVSARSINAAGSFRVYAEKKTETSIEQLDAHVVSSVLPHPHTLRISEARVETDKYKETLHTRAAEVAVNEKWRLHDFDLKRREDSSGADERPIELRGRLSSDDGGSLRVGGHADTDERSYEFEVEATSFRPDDWPGAPKLAGLVLDGAGKVSGTGFRKEDVDATVQWSANDVTVGGEELDRVDLVAHVRPRRLDIRELDVSGADFAASAEGYLYKNGAFKLAVDAHTDGTRLAKRLASIFGTKLATLGRLEVSTEARGKLDLDARGVVEMLERAKFDTDWKAERLGFADTRWKTAGGSLLLSLPVTARAKRKKRMVVYKASAVAHELHHDSLSAGLARATASGDFLLRDGTDVSTLHYTLETEASRLQFGEHRAKKAHLGLRGSLLVSDGKTNDLARGNWPLETLAARGTVDLLGYQSDEVFAKRVAANINVRGEFPVGEGTVEVHTTGLRANGRRFRASRLELRLLDDQKFRLRSKSRVEVDIIPDLPLYLDVSGRHGRDLKALSVEKFEVGRPGMRWKTKRPGLVLFKDGAVVVQSLTLYRLAQKVRLDGAYGGGRQGSLSAICNRLKDAQLRSFLDVGTMIEEKLHIGRTLRKIF